MPYFETWFNRVPHKTIMWYYFNTRWPNNVAICLIGDLDCMLPIWCSNMACVIMKLH